MADNDNAQPTPMPTPDPALKRLEPLVGKWNLTGRTFDSAEDNIFGWNTFEWLPGGFFLESRGEIDFKGSKIRSLEIIGYDPASQTFPSTVYSDMSGTAFPYKWNVEGNTVTHWTDRSKYTGTLSEDGKTLMGGWRPDQGKESEENVAYDAVMTRVD
jgi:hypothetical protein